MYGRSNVKVRLHRYIRLQGQLSGNTEASNQSCPWTAQNQAQHSKHADTNLANSKTSAWFIKSLRHIAPF